MPDVIVDLFPAEVATDETTWRSARALITSDRVYVVTRSGPAGWELAAVLGYTSMVRGRGRSYDLTLDDGSGCQVRKGSGCGCGSPLKRLNRSAILAGAAA